MNIDYVTFAQQSYGLFFTVFKEGNEKVAKFIHSANNRYGYIDSAGLCGACQGGHMDLVKFMLDNQVRIDESSVLEHACIKGNMDIVQLIMKTIPGCRLKDGLRGACKGGHIRMVKMLINEGTSDYNYGLYGACYGGHIDIAKMMIDKGASDLDQALHEACKGGHMNIIDLLVSESYNYLWGDLYWDYGLEGASEGGHLDIVKLMISKGANHYIEALMMARREGHMNVVQYLSRKVTIKQLKSMTKAKFFPERNKKTKYFHNDYYIGNKDTKKYFMRETILHWTIVYNERCTNKNVVQRDLIPDLLKLLYF